MALSKESTGVEKGRATLRRSAPDNHIGDPADTWWWNALRTGWREAGKQDNDEDKRPDLEAHCPFDDSIFQNRVPAVHLYTRRKGYG